MTKFTKLIAAVALLWLVAAQATPLMAQQNYDFQVGQLYYKITDATKRKVAVVGGNNKPTGAITIPAIVVNGGNTYSVTSIGKSAFYVCSGLTSINIPNSVTSIGEWAFAGCSGLTSIKIPSGITKIEYGTFSGCKGLTSINIPSSVTSIGDNFGILSDDIGAFSGCKGLTSIDIPSSVTIIGLYTFSGCTGLTSINIPSGVTSIEAYTFEKCSGLTSINIPNGITKIEAGTFSGCTGLTSINIPNSVTSIGEKAFYGCKGLTSINIPSGVTKIKYDTFSGCEGLNSINIPNSVTSIGGAAFSYCSGLTSITIPNSVTSIGYGAFYGCSRLTSIVIPTSCEASIATGVLAGCSGLTSITIPSSVTSIDSAAFYGCSGLTSITIPNSITSIGESAFSGCSGLTSINIPSSVTSIGRRAFYGCNGLDSVIVHWQTPLQVDTSVFGGVALNYVSLIVPAGKKSVYQHSDVWKYFNPIVEPSYTIVYNISVNGTFTVKDGSQEISSGIKLEYGTVLTIEATAAEHYKLDSILVNGTRIEGLSFTVTGNTNIEVFFGKQSYTVTYNSNMYSGKIEVTRGSEIVASGSSVEYGTQLMVRAIPNHGFEVKSLTINDQAILNDFVFSIWEPIEIKAVFTPATTALDEAATEPLAIYPNPMAEVLYLSATARTIRIYDMYGTEVAHATDTDKVEVSHLPAGVYTVRADGKKAKVVKK